MLLYPYGSLLSDPEILLELVSSIDRSSETGIGGEAKRFLSMILIHRTELNGIDPCRRPGKYGIILWLITEYGGHFSLGVREVVVTPDPLIRSVIALSCRRAVCFMWTL